MLRNRHISSIPRRARGLRMQAGAGHSFSTHIALELYCWHTFRVERVELHRNRHISSIPRVTMPIRVRGRSRGAEYEGGSQAPF